MAFTGEVNTMLLGKLPPKLENPSSFTIPSWIGDQLFERALLDLGAGVNLLPYTVYESFNLLLSPCNWQIEA